MQQYWLEGAQLLLSITAWVLPARLDDKDQLSLHLILQKVWGNPCTVTFHLAYRMEIAERWGQGVLAEESLT